MGVPSNRASASLGVSTQRSGLQEADAIREFEAVARKIEAKEYVPNTAYCVRCDFKQSCRHSVAKTAQGAPA